jgi:hypothetical protein
MAERYCLTGRRDICQPVVAMGATVVGFYDVEAFPGLVSIDLEEACI